MLAKQNDVAICLQSEMMLQTANRSFRCAQDDGILLV
jgi:hypothetical protein